MRSSPSFLPPNFPVGEILDGIDESACIASCSGMILCSNAPWQRLTRPAKLGLGDDVSAWLRLQAQAGNDGAQSILDGIDSILNGKQSRFRASLSVGREQSSREYSVKVSLMWFGCLRYLLLTGSDRTAVTRLKEQRHQLGVAVLLAQQEERRRIARELHDSTAQFLVALQLDLIRLKQSEVDEAGRTIIAECEQMLRLAHREIRSLSYIYHPPAMEGQGLVAALGSLSRGFGQRTGIDVSARLPEAFILDRDRESALYRVAQEAFANIYRHSRATRARVSLLRTRRGLHLMIEDNGIGFSVSACRPLASLGVGVTSMTERMRDLGGRLSVRGSERGTRVHASLLLKA